jgi:hypothetical protein
MGEPRRSWAGVMVVAGLVTLVTLVVLAALLPLGTESGPEPRAPNGLPPAWLVDQAYRMAYANGDITPDSAEWVLSGADTIAPAVGLESGDPSVQEFFVVLHGNFTAYEAKVPVGADLPKGSILTFAVGVDSHEVTDWGVSDQAVDVPGLQSFSLPDASQTYTSPAGWSLAVPPGWKTDAFSSEGTMFANMTLPAPSADDPTIWKGDLPLDAVALVVATAPAAIPPDAETVKPPVSFDDFATLDSLTGAGSTYFTALVQGPNGRFVATVRLGDQVSAIDRAAIADVISSLTFEPQSSA